jgi:response regulator receiver domain-containing protein
VVDDEPEVARVLADMLKSKGHQVEAVTNGSMALEKLSGQPHDLIVSDIRMPGLDGPTGDTLSPTVREFLGQVDAPGLSKPFVWEEVRRIVPQALLGGSLAPSSPAPRRP